MKRLIVFLLLAFPPISSAQSNRLESDPSVLRVLPPSYPSNRVRVDARQYPWSAIGRIALYDSVLRPGGQTSCTGTLVDEQLVLTAAHCIWDRRDFPGEVRFAAGVHQDSHIAYSKAKNIYFSDEFEIGPASPSTWAVDWALIELEKPIGKKTGYLGLGDFDTTVFERLNKEELVFKVSGYRGDRLFVQTVDHGCRIDGFSYEGKLVLHRCPIIGGDSGGPILLPFHDDLLIVGIDVGVLGKSHVSLKVGNKRIGVAIPSSSFAGKLNEFGMTMQILEASSGLVGRLGLNPTVPK